MKDLRNLTWVGQLLNAARATDSPESQYLLGSDNRDK